LSEHVSYFNKINLINYFISNQDFRQDIYEDYSFPLDATSDGTYPLKSFDLHSLRNYAKHYGKSLFQI
jgi:hypothetical protein